MRCHTGCGAYHNHHSGGAPRSDKPGIIAQHDRIRRERGWAGEYNCSGCNGVASDWANITGTDRENINNYIPLCRYCHIIYDRIRGYDHDTILECLGNSEWRTKAMAKVMRDMRRGGGRDEIR